MYVSDDYHPEIDDAEAAALGIKSPIEMLVLNIVTLHEDGSVTVNLKGPIVINRKTLWAKQMLPANAAELSLRHPLNVSQP